MLKILKDFWLNVIDFKTPSAVTDGSTGGMRTCKHAPTQQHTHPHIHTHRLANKKNTCGCACMHSEPSLTEIINRALDARLMTVNGWIFKEENSRALPILHTNTISSPIESIHSKDKPFCKHS